MTPAIRLGRLPLALALPLLLAAPSVGLGATFTYSGASADPGYWYNITNWIPYGVPGVSDTIIIPSGPVGIPDGTYADVRLTGGAIQGTFTVGGTLLWTSGTLAGTVTVATNGVLDLDFQSAGTLTGLLTNHGRIVWSAGSYPAWFFNNGRLENAADGLLDAQVDCQFYNFGGTAQINNAGVIRKERGRRHGRVPSGGCAAKHRSAGRADRRSAIQRRFHQQRHFQRDQRLEA